MPEALTAVQEAQAQELAKALEELTREDLLAIARTLTATSPASLFGDTEFKLRKLSHRIASKALERHLDSPKKATSLPD